MYACRTLTHGTVQKVMRTGRVAEQWQGGTCEVAKRVSASACHGIIDRNGECMRDHNKEALFL